MGKICNVYIGINGIYEMGTGYVSNEAREAYKEALNCIKSTKFRYVKFNDCDYLCGLYGNLFIHPMEISGILYSSNCADGNVFDYILYGLNEIMQQIVFYMKECADIDVKYQIRFAYTDIPKELYNFEEWSEHYV